MDTQTRDLYMKVDAAEYVLNLMMEVGATSCALDKQREHCRGLRAQLNAICPDGSYDPNERNIVEKV